MNYIWENILQARKVLSSIARKTPLEKSTTFSRMCRAEIYLKLENLQKTGSFKIRGAYYKIWKLLNKGKRITACVTASSGNHAQGVAYAASCLGLKSIIVMPEFTPIAKIEATRSYGAEIILYGRTYDEAYSKALEICRRIKGVFIHAFNDPDVIAGQGTIGLEVYQDLKDVEIVVVPIGGGGLISGISIALKKLNPNIKVIGVEAEGAPAMKLSIEKGHIVEIKEIDTIADGIAVKKPGDITFNIVRNLVDDIVLVSDEEIARAVFLLLERSKIVVEPAGAVGIAALISGKINVEGRKVAVIISGGNIDMTLLSRIIEWGLVLEGRVARLRGILPDRPGSLRNIVEVLAKMKINILDIKHYRAKPYLRPGKAEVLLEVEIPDRRIIGKLLKLLEEKGYTFNIVE